MSAPTHIDPAVRAVEAQLRALGWTDAELWGVIDPRPYECEPGLLTRLRGDRYLGAFNEDFAEIICPRPYQEPSILRQWRRGRESWITRVRRGESVRPTPPATPPERTPVR